MWAAGAEREHVCAREEGVWVGTSGRKQSWVLSGRVQSPPPPCVVSGLREKVRLDCPVDRYKPALDGTTRPDHVVRMGVDGVIEGRRWRCLRVYESIVFS